MTPRALVKDVVYGTAALAGLLLGFMGQQLWADSRDHGDRINRSEVKIDGHTEILVDVRDDVREMRADIKELLRRSP